LSHEFSILTVVMQRLCFHFQLNQPQRLRTYRFFDINEKHDYFDDFQNRYLANRLAERSYLPMNELLFQLISQWGNKAAFSFSISGSSLLLFEQYNPEVLDSFRKLVETKQVEITGNTFSHSLASLYNKSVFEEQVNLQKELLKQLFDIRPLTFCNTECIYSDEIGEWLFDLGYKIMLTEGAKHILGWKNSGYLYCNPYQTDLRLLLRNASLSNDIALRFNDRNWNMYPLTAEKFIEFLQSVPKEIPFINLFMDYEIFGENYTVDTGIFDFFRALIEQLLKSGNYELIKPEDLLDMETAVATLHVPWAISTFGEEKDTSEWLGNELQQEAFEQIFKLEKAYRISKDKTAKKAWLQMQDAHHFGYMSTKWFPKPSVKQNFDVYLSPYQAFINYMNVINDIELQLGVGNKVRG